MSWDDVRYVLAVADHGSVNAAAKALGVTHATVLRRVAAFEQAQGGPVFDRGASGYRVAEGRAAVIEAAREVAEAVRSVDRLMHGANAPLRGEVRIASTDSFCQLVLPDVLQRMHERAPDLIVELLSGNHRLDFGRLQAEISIRPTPALPEDMTGKIAADLAFGAYAAPGKADSWLGLHGTLARSAPARWMEAQVAKSRIGGGADSFLVLAQLARCGLGVAAMPCFVGDATPGLERRRDLMPPMSVPVWVATHVDLREAPRIRHARRLLEALLAECGPRLRGEA